MAEVFSSAEISILIDIVCHGRPYSAKEVWQWLEKDDIESMMTGEITIIDIALTLDSIQKSGQRLNPSNHNMPFPDPDTPVSKEADDNKIQIGY
jgi:hypothetical protein